MTTQQTTLMHGVTLTAVHTGTFKSGYSCLRLLCPLDRDTLTLTAALPDTLIQGTDRLQNPRAVRRELQELYGTELTPVCHRAGDLQCVGYDARFLDDGSAPEGSQMTRRVILLLGEVLLHPATRNARLRPDCAEAARRGRVRAVEAAGALRAGSVKDLLISKMYHDKAYALGAQGLENRLEEITYQRLNARYRDLLEHARVELFTVSSLPARQVELFWRESLMALPRALDLWDTPSDRQPFLREKVRLYRETWDLPGTGLGLGFQTGVPAGSGESAALGVVLEVLGELLQQPREGEDNAWSVWTDPLKSLVILSKGDLPAPESGLRRDIRAWNEAMARREQALLDRLERLASGGMTQAQVERAKGRLTARLRRAMDSPDGMSRAWIRDRAAGLKLDLPGLIRRVEDVTPGEAEAAVLQLHPDTVLRLLPRRAEEGPGGEEM